MAKLSAVYLIFLTLGCAWSYYYQSYPQHPPQNVIYRHHFPAYHSPTPYINHAPIAPPMNPVPIAPHMNPVPLTPHMNRVPLTPPMNPVPFTPAMNPVPVAPSYQSAYSPHPYPQQFPKIPANYMFPSPSQPAPHQVPYNPVSYQSNYYSPSQSYHPPPTSHSYTPYSSYSPPFTGYAPKQNFLNKIKPFLFGHTSPKSLPHHPFYPNHHHPHHYSPNKGFHNQQPHHHGHHLENHHQMHHMHGMQQHSCSCSLHVGHLTVYKHIDMRASYSCHDLKDCKSFCTNLFSSEDLRAQTRADACLLLGKDGSVPWFRRDQVCGHHGLHNDTKLSVDLCCKDLQPC